MTHDDEPASLQIRVDIIIPVHNSAATLHQALTSATHQVLTISKDSNHHDYTIVIFVCCFDDGSTDDSWLILQNFKRKHDEQQALANCKSQRKNLETHVCIATSADGVARGAGFARNRAVDLGRHCNTMEDPKSNCAWDEHFLCWLDSDDVMRPTRVIEQVSYMMLLSKQERNRAIVGCQFDRDPPDATWHYAHWANQLSDERLTLERFRELTVIQPTWIMTRDRFIALGGYLEAPHPKHNDVTFEAFYNKELLTRGRDNKKGSSFVMIHSAETLETLRVAEDLRLFHKHVWADGRLHLCRGGPLLTYAHSKQSSQSARTSRILLLRLRVLAFETCVLQNEWKEKFVVWGAGRDGKDFVKALSPASRMRVYCFVDVDETKIERGCYINRELGLNIPIVHFSVLIRCDVARQQVQQAWLRGDDACNGGFGRIDKGKPVQEELAFSLDQSVSPGPSTKIRRRRQLYKADVEKIVDMKLMPLLPVVVAVVMYRTQGALEHNVKSIGRIEGKDLWHFS